MDIFSLNSTNQQSLKQLPLTCNGHTRPIVYLFFSPITDDGFYLISASKDGKPMLRKGETGDWIGTFEGHKGAVWGVALNNNATRAATASADFTAKLWNAKYGNEEYSFSHEHIVKSVDFSADGKSLLTSSNDKTLRIFDLQNFSSSPQLFKGHEDLLKQAVFFDTDGNRIVSCSCDKTVRFWDKRAGQETSKLAFSEQPNGIEVSFGQKILSICYGQNIAFYDLESLTKIKEFHAPSTIVNTSSLNPELNTFVCGGSDFLIYKCDFETLSIIDSYSGHFGAVHCLRYSPDGEIYASGSEDGTLRLWQNTIGKTYGLWQYVGSDKTENEG
ncbi:Serine-threonine kinase receptor-associated protein [Sarcoptes scabiei]|uniref:Serine-threonine kinase receptor-associated protein n=1 Tax=Sarcoptes scabiei TaxID=52283 RepID=A0A132AE71_SARSC|nr:Serine-threonine kinase receptor-associated protein [Sarcoptes scabiei]KPM09286.1 WD40 domain containing protein 2 [Sarcoptes scabiei]